MDQSVAQGEGGRSLESPLQHLGWVRRLAAALVGGGPDADDVAQEAWSRALENPPPRSVSWKAWLGGIVRHTVRDRRRAERRRKRREIDSAAPEGRGEDAADLLERVEEERALLQLVTSMEEPYRTVLLRRFFDSWSITQIARSHGIPEGTARTQLRRGLERLRERALHERGAGAERWLSGIAFVRPEQVASASAATFSTTGTLLAAAILMLKVAALFVAAAALAFMALGPDSLPTPVAVDHTDLEVATPTESLVAIANDPSRTFRAAVEPPLVEPLSDSPAAPAAVEPGKTGFIVKGQVLTGDVPLELDGCSVGFSSLDFDRKEHASVEIGTDGRFELVVSPGLAVEGERVLARLVGKGTFGASQVELELRPEVVVHLPPTLRAHGRLSTTPERSLGEAYVRLSDVDGHQFLGHCKVEPDGQFALFIRPYAWISQVYITAYSNGRTVLQEVVELAALISAKGLHYDFEMAVVELAVIDMEGRPVEGAILVVDSIPARHFQQKSIDLGATGMATLNLAPKGFNLLIQAPGFEPKVGGFDAEPSDSSVQRVEVVMKRASEVSAEGDPVRLFGTVTLGGTERVEDVFVSASAQAESWSVGHALFFEGVRTDESGEYELMLPRPGVYMVTAADRAGPGTKTRPISVMHDLRLDLDMTPEARVVLRPVGAVDHLKQSHGFVEWQRVQDEGESIDLSRSKSPHFLYVRPDRSYRVMGRLLGTDLFGTTEVSIPAIAQAVPIRVPFIQAPLASGTLLDASGAPVEGARVVASSGSGPYRFAPPQWRSATTDEAGSFEIFALGALNGEETLQLVVEPSSTSPPTTFQISVSQRATLTLE